MNVELDGGAGSLIAERPVFHANCMEGRTVFVTGASSGLGRAAAISLSKLGATLIINGRDTERLETTRSMLLGSGHGLFVGELSSADKTAEIIKGAVEQYGPLDGIFHSAGVFKVLPAKMTKQRHLDELFGASVPGAYGIARAVSSRTIMNDGGSIVFMSSVAGVRGDVGLTAYSGAKAAILGLNGALAVELASRRIRSNAVVAGTVLTEMVLQAPKFEARADENAGKHLLGYGQPSDVVNAVIFLLSDASRWVTGTSIAVDGGYLA